jgi:hypothetical protein
MYFDKNLKAWACSLFTTLSLTACELPLFEAPPPPSPVNVSLGDAEGCMSKVFPVLEDFFSGTAQEPQLIATWNCVSTALDTFEKSVQGRFEDRFTDKEVGHFIEQYFLDEGDEITQEMMYQVFLIKQLFVGGDVTSITRTELNNLEKVISEIREISIDINAYMSIYSMNWKIERDYSDIDIDKFEKANSALQDAAKELAKIIERNGKAYDLSNFVPLLQELGKLADDGWPWIDDVEKTLPLIKKLKKTLSGGDESVIEPKEWRRFALLGARGFVQYLRYNYFIKNSPISKGGNYLAYFIRSIDDLFSYLGDMVEGKPGQILSRQELLEVSNALSALIEDFKMSDELLLEIMKVKVVLFGGDVDLFVKADFDRARKKLDEFRQITQKFLDYKDLFSQDWQTQGLTDSQKLATMKLAEVNMLEVARRIGGIIEASYNLNSLKSLAYEFEKLYPTEDPLKSAWNELADQYVPLIIVGKQIALSDDTPVLGSGSQNQVSKQWSQFLELAGNLYMRYLTYFYFLKGNEIESSSVTFGSDRLVNDAISTLLNLVQSKPQNQISFAELDRLAEALVQSKFLPEKITAMTLQSTLRTLLNKVLMSPDERLLGNTSTGLDAVALRIVKSEFSLWIENQKFFEFEFAGLKPGEGRTGTQILADIEKLVGTVALLEMKMALTGPIDLSYDSQGRLFLGQTQLPYSKKTMTIFNMVRSGSRLLVRSFAKDLNRIVGYLGLTESEVNELYLELRPILSELLVVHPKDDDFGLSRFRDAGLFTDIGDGNDLASFQEISRLLMLLLSGIENDSLIFDPMEQAGICVVNKNSSDYKKDWVTSLGCVRGHYLKEIPKFYLGLPEFLKFKAGLDQGRLDKMFNNLVVAAGHPEKNGDQLSVGDLSLVPQIMQYIEVFYQVYDANRNGQIETPEALESYVKFESILKSVSGLTKENELKGLLTWMLRYGKPPESIGDKIKFKTWWVPKGESGWVVNAERDQMASILAFISKAIEEAKEK